MKKKYRFCILAIIVLAGACSAAGSPKAVVQKFYAAIEKNDTKAMAELATPETLQLMTMFGTKIQGLVAENGKIKKTTEDVDGDTAIVTVTFENGEESNVELIKVDGKWKVSMSMDK